MKKISEFISFALIITMLISCKTPSQVFKVRAPMGTEIYTPDLEYITTVSSDQAKIKLSGKNYYAYLLARSQNSQDYVPFALDYKNTNDAVRILAASTGSNALLSTGLVCGTLGALEPNTALFVGGTAAFVGGVYYACRIGARKRSVQASYNYRYLDYQTTNQDFVFIYPVDNASVKMLDSVSPFALQSGKYGQSGNNVASVQSSSMARSRVITDKVNRRLNVGARKIEGGYIGNGNLSLNGEILEELTDIRVYLKYVDKNTVSVDVVEANGNSFFQKSSKYNVKQETSRKQILTHENIKDAVITVEGRNMKYIHPKVNIDNEIYVLKITLKKE